MLSIITQIIPMAKSSRTDDPIQYSPISLLSILSKLLEKHIKKCLLSNLKQSFCDFWSFLQGRLTTGALVSAVDSWHRLLESGIDV